MQLDANPQLMILVGPPGSGKSQAIQSIITDMYNTKRINFGIAFVGSKFAGNYDYLPDDMVKEGYDEQELQNYVEEVASFIRKNKIKRAPQSFILFDDLMGVMDLYSPFFTNLIARFRHFGFNIIFGVQYLKKGVPTTVRECMTVAMMWRSYNKESFDACYTYFGQVAHDEKQFEELYDKATSVQHRCLVFQPPSNIYGERPKSRDALIAYSYYGYIAPAKIKKIKLYKKNLKKNESAKNSIKSPVNGDEQQLLNTFKGESWWYS